MLVSHAAFTMSAPLSDLVAGVHECQAFAILAPAFCRSVASLLDRTADADLAAMLTAGLARLPDAAAYYDTKEPVDAATLVLARRARADLAAAIDAALSGHTGDPGVDDDAEGVDDGICSPHRRERPGQRHCFQFRIAAAVAIATPRVDLLGPLAVRALVDLALDLVDCGALPDIAVDVDDGEVPGCGRCSPHVAIAARAPWLCCRLVRTPADAGLQDTVRVSFFFGLDNLSNGATSDDRAVRVAASGRTSGWRCSADHVQLPKTSGLLAVAASWLRSTSAIEHRAAQALPYLSPSRRATRRAVLYAAPFGSAAAAVRDCAARAWTAACAKRTPATDIGWALPTPQNAAGDRSIVPRVGRDVAASARSALCRAAVSAADKRRNDGAAGLDWAWRLLEADVWSGGTGILAAWPAVHKTCVQACAYLVQAPYAADRAAALVAHAASAWLGRGAVACASALARELDHAAATTVDAVATELTAQLADAYSVAVSAAARLGLGVAAAGAAVGVQAIGSGRLRNAIALVASAAPDALPGAARDVLLAAARRDGSDDVIAAWLAVRDAISSAARTSPPRPAALVGLHRLLVDLARIRACLAIPGPSLRNDIVALYLQLDRHLDIGIPDVDPALMRALRDLLAHAAELADQPRTRLNDITSRCGVSRVPPAGGDSPHSPASLHDCLVVSEGMLDLTPSEPHVV